MKLKIMNLDNRQALLGLALLFSACPVSKPSDAGPQLLSDGGLALTRNEFLGAAGQCSLREATEFRAKVDALVAAPTRDSWKAAMAAWQRVELMQYGPTGTSSAPGGQDLRDQIYSWPLPNRCNIEETLVNKRYEAGVGSLLVNRRGLGALEYLLFHETDDFMCMSAEWNALAPAEKATRRQAYANAVIADLKVRADQLVAAWEGGFIDTLKTAGPGNPTYMTTAAAMNRVSNALFYVDLEMKDIKLAPAIGLRECAAPPCLDKLESQYANHNTANLRQNLVGFRQLFEGCEANYSGIGFDDLLFAARADDLAARMLEKTKIAQADLEAINEPDLRDALVSDPQSVRDFYDSLKAVTDLLKTEFVTVLDLELPMGLEGDND
jgi:predicted lipoprotein